MHKWMIFTGGLALVAMISACGPKSTVVLVPDPDGYVGKISVSNEAGSVDIDHAHQRTVVRGGKTAPTEPRSIDPNEVEGLFKGALASQPPPPVHFIFYFQSDSVTLNPESERQLPETAALIQRRIPTTVSVIGHSDTLGNKDYNLELSLRRARSVRRQLVELGVPESSIEVSSHGEENPLVKTADNVANVKNRRVEVVVR
jgi:outer membrane protein OmpA-like peptidoglycan-associated protein